MVIKLFSPNVKYRNSVPDSVQHVTPLDKPHFSISTRLLRLVSILIQKYYMLLITECEIFLSLIVKFLDPDKPTWQRSLALEVMHKMTVQSDLLQSFCRSYDMKPHATNIFQDIVNSLGAYVQSLFVNPQLMGQGVLSANASMVAQGHPPSILTGVPVSPNGSPMPGFFYRGVWYPIIVTMPNGVAKPMYLEMLDKNEPPVIPDGHGVSMAFACLVDIISSISAIVEGVHLSEVDERKQASPSDEKGLHVQLVNSSWCGLLAALSLLLEASTSESACDIILKSIQTYANLCGKLELSVSRDAFITAVCKASLPPHYALTVLNSASQTTGSTRGHTRAASQDLNQYASSQFMEEFKHVIVVGTPLPTASLPAVAQQGPVMLTAKNLQAMRTLLNIACHHGSILGSAWHLVLTTLQHLVWILGLRPSTGGSLSADSNPGITNAVMADVPVLSTMLSRLFESSQHLDDVALHHLVDALCKLSHEAMEMAYSNREPSLFAVAKLLETGLVNLPRVQVLWRPLTNHLLEVCQHPHIRMREWGVEAVTYLVKAALLHKYQPPLKEDQKLQTLLLGPLVELSTIPHSDIRQKQLECMLQVLHSAGEILSHGWPLVLDVVGAISDNQGENLIRLAFQCLQLVVTDFLPVMPWHCLPLCVYTAAKFGSQTQEMNISLTAVGLMWNISDYFFQNQEKLQQALTTETKVFPEFPGISDMPTFDKMWMCLYARLGDLCVDSRPAVRKSAGQTLFSTISAHGMLLQQETWQVVLWQVLFPMLDKVRKLSDTASSKKVDSEGSLLIHHSRNTAQKQWAETQVLTLSGVARVFNTKRRLLETLGDFPRAWALLLEFIESGALSKNNEVSLAALKAFQEILYVNKNLSDSEGDVSPSLIEDTGSGDSIRKDAAVEDDEAVCTWNVAWKVWCNVGTNSTMPPEKDARPEDIYVPSQAFLTALVQIFPGLFRHLHSRFVQADLNKLCTVLQNAVAVPIYGEASPFILPSLTEVVLTPLQDKVLQCFEMLYLEALSSNANLKTMVPVIFSQLLTFCKYSCQAPDFGSLEVKHTNQVKGISADWVTLSYVPFGERALAMATSLYQKTASDANVIESHVLENVVKALRIPMAFKYDCYSQTTWKLAVNSLLEVLKRGLPLVKLHPQHFKGVWPELALALDEFLFSKSLPPMNQTAEENQRDEAVDCQVVELIRDNVLTHSATLPNEFVMQMMVLLNKGSIHCATSSLTAGYSSHDGDYSNRLREDFAKLCFETLLQYALCSQISNHKQEGSRETAVPFLGYITGNADGNVCTEQLSSRLAITSLLHRFEEVLHKFVQEERLSGKCPLPRHRLSEISFVLKAITTLISSLKKAPEKVDSTTWQQLINLYPYLVNCTTTASAQVLRSLCEALHEYRDLLHPPKTLLNGI